MSTAVNVKETSHCSELKDKIMERTKVVHSAYVPAQLERHLEFLTFNSKGHLILGCSNLTGRYWIGSLWYYRSPQEAPSVEKSLTGVDLDNGVVDGFFVDDKQLFVATDNGAVEQVTLSFSVEETDDDESYFFLERAHSVQEHDDIITGIQMTADKRQIVTASYDRSVVVLDAKTLRLESRINEAHDELIGGIAANKVEPHLAATAANDGTVTTFDLRTSSRLECIYENKSLWPTCTEWLPSSQHQLLVGNQAGQIQLYDIRKPKCEVAASSLQEGKPVTRIRFCPSDASIFAVCCETYPVTLLQLDGEHINSKYEDKRHEDYVRDVAWQPKTNEMYSCGWDHKVFSHKC